MSFLMIAARFARVGGNSPRAWKPWACRVWASVMNRPGDCSARTALCRARRFSRFRPPVGARSPAAAPGQERVGLAGRRVEPAGAIAQPDSGRPLRPAEPDPRGIDPAGTGLRPARFPAALPWRRHAAESVPAFVRRPPRARGRRPLERLCRLYPRTAGSGPGPGKPHRHLPHPADRFSQPARRTPGRLLHHPARHAAIAFRAAVRQSARRAPLARPAKPKLLRGRLPRPLPRLYARRRRRPDGPRHERLPEDPRRPLARRCHSPPHARRGSRSPGVACRLDERRGRDWSKPRGAGRSSWPTPWAAASWNRRH